METLNFQELLANAKKQASKPKKPTASSFEVREGTPAVCRMVTGDIVAGVLFHAILELWVETKRKVVRDGKEWLFLSGDQLQTLSGLTKKQLEGNAVPKLRSCSFIEMGRGRLTPEEPNKYRIRLDHNAFWLEVAAILDPTKEITTKEDGHEWTRKMVDRNKLPYLFKRLHDAASVNG